MLFQFFPLLAHVDDIVVVDLDLLSQEEEEGSSSSSSSTRSFMTPSRSLLQQRAAVYK